jgi:hypothetical protein
MKIHKDQYFNSLISTNVLKIPRYEFLSDIGDEWGMLGDIVVETSTGDFCWHNGITWVCVSGGGTGDITTLTSLGGISLVGNGIGPNLTITGLESSDGSVTITPTGNTIDLSVMGGGPSTPSLWSLSNINDYVQNTAIPGVAFGVNNLTFGADGTESSEVGANTTRFFFIADSSDSSYGSLRAGRATGTQWDLSNRGLLSVAFGNDNICSSFASCVSGGTLNIIDSTCTDSFIGAGKVNSILTDSISSSIVSGQGNIIEDSSNLSSILTGETNIIRGSVLSNINSGNQNVIEAFSNSSSILCGLQNNINSSFYSSILSGQGHSIENSANSFISGGFSNVMVTGSDCSIICCNNAAMLGVGQSTMINIIGHANNSNTNEGLSLWSYNLRTLGGRRKQVRIIPATSPTITLNEDDHIIYVQTQGISNKTINLPLNPFEGMELYIRHDAKNINATVTIQTNPPAVINWIGPTGIPPQPALTPNFILTGTGNTPAFSVHLIYVNTPKVPPILSQTLTPPEWVVLNIQ